ncbi:uncharacterized protein MELLADRAFT_96324 [Melampsora larici-populina 98AG31]|uniref:Uncharacterized protein n=1 Tax=Melampsora larici-populina (strain 98AG31 / pathotype 3-4-7) TaxID=747676 RepID=F4RED2_MELLP|nr:uncharacterized protein MELLADRAFT_96324 [Melampsora larici-populina 98AG31]EGG09292.1 hypothetical protein MELLADRAFT_96324 [Melampsora larici-populina 98AG31]
MIWYTIEVCQATEIRKLKPPHNCECDTVIVKYSLATAQLTRPCMVLREIQVKNCQFDVINSLQTPISQYAYLTTTIKIN